MKQSKTALKNGIQIALATALMAAGLSSCSTVSSKKELPPETSDKEIIQLAQQAFNNRNYKLSTHYYNVLLQRYGNNTVDYIIGNFEIAHIALKKKDYSTAVPLLNEVLLIYKDTPAGYLPASYRVLALNDLKKVPEQKRSSISASGRFNDYYEDDDYGDTDFFGISPFDNIDTGDSDDTGYTDDADDADGPQYEGTFPGGSFWY